MIIKFKNRKAERQPTDTGTRIKKSAILASISSILALLCYGPASMAANPLLNVISPTEWYMPVLKEGTLVYLQSAILQSSDKFYDRDGNSHTFEGPTSASGAPNLDHSVSGISRFAYVWSFESLPNVGWIAEYFQPYASARIYDAGDSVTGLADPLFLGGPYINPTPNSMIGYLGVVGAPFGSNDLSNHFWSYTNLIPMYYERNDVTLESTLLYTIVGDQYHGGRKVHVGDSYSANVQVGYRVKPWLVPFVSYAWVKNETSRDADTGEAVRGMGPSTYACHGVLNGSGKCQEQTLGGGVEFHFGKGDTNKLMLKYATSVDGENANKTNAFYLFFVHPLLNS
ncbi:transporter [Algiphilus sp. W345]|uniref:Transporter n=1 Tax=Banduia mediterranea TaxID=3075609 RepID=A0ABU2WL82_9GAMM|nr:transporter [Algiphilus sp. W345]MDT0497802.1 transporter [Algiphilus sp. W345]